MQTDNMVRSAVWISIGHQSETKEKQVYVQHGNVNNGHGMQIARAMHPRAFVSILNINFNHMLHNQGLATAYKSEQYT